MEAIAVEFATAAHGSRVRLRSRACVSTSPVHRPRERGTCDRSSTPAAAQWPPALRKPGQEVLVSWRRRVARHMPAPLRVILSGSPWRASALPGQGWMSSGYSRAEAIGVAATMKRSRIATLVLSRPLPSLDILCRSQSPSPQGSRRSAVVRTAWSGSPASRAWRRGAPGTRRAR